MSYVSFLSRRYASAGRSNKFVSFIVLVAVIGVMLGTAALNIALSVISGFEKQLQSSIVSFTSEIEVRGFQSKPLPEYVNALQRMHDSIPGVQAVGPFALREVIIRSHAGIEGIILKGLDTAHMVTTVNKHMTDGKFFLDAPPHGLATVVIGKRLAEKLDINVGDSVVVFSLSGVPSPLNPARVDKLVVSGFYETGYAEYDDIYAYTALPAAQQMFDLPAGSVSGFDVMTGSTDSLSAIADHIEHTMGYPYYALTMYDLYPSIFAWIDLQKQLIPIVLGLIIIVASFNIIATLLMIVLEKTHAIGILKTLGATASGVRRIFLSQGIFIGVVGIISGDVLGFVLCYIQQSYHIIKLKSDVYFMNYAPIDMHLSSFIIVSLIAFALSLAATYVPARIASRLVPLQALRFG